MVPGHTLCFPLKPFTDLFLPLGFNALALPYFLIAGNLAMTLFWTTEEEPHFTKGAWSSMCACVLNFKKHCSK